MIAGLSTFAVTDRPVSARAKMNWLTVVDVAARTVERMRQVLPMFMIGYRPCSSESGAMRSGPAASPSSQIVTRRTLAAAARVVDGLEEPEWAERSATMVDARGTMEMHVNVLEGVLVFGEK